jgi:tetratricopeptide (TPR) repeat protein
MALDPLAFVHPMNLSDVLAIQARFADAVTAAQQSVALGARNDGYDRLFWAYVGAGQLDRAEEAMRKSCALNASENRCRIDRLQLLAVRGKRAQAIALLEPMAKKLESGDYNVPNSPSSVAQYYVLLQDIPQATAAQRLALDHDDWFPTMALVWMLGGAKLPEEISTDPEWQVVWSDPKLREMMEVYRKNLTAFRNGK